MLTKFGKKSTKKLKSKEFYVNIRSRHPSHEPLRKALSKLSFRSIVRLGSTTDLNDGKNRVECNTISAVQNSSNKLLMKRKFKENDVITTDWWVANPKLSGVTFHEQEDANKSIVLSDLPYPIVAKHIYGSRNNGNTLIKTKEELTEWLKNKTLSNYIFERYFGAVREYRLHVTKDGYFYSCRKMLKKDTPEDKRWFRNDSNCSWIKEENPMFNKPESWDSIVNESVKALKAVGLDIGAVDVKVKSNGKDFKILEINSAPSFGEITLEKYQQEIPKILKSKLYE